MVFDSIKNLPIIVFGAGSIGERHIGVLQDLGFTKVLIFRQRNLPLRNVPKMEVTILTEWSEIIEQKPFAAIICTPTSQHSEQLLKCLQLNMHVLVEKPLSHQSERLAPFIQILETAPPLHVQIAYMLRYHPAIQIVKMHVDKQILGPLLHSNSYWGEYLPDWHPWEDYTQSYAAQKQLGGGSALTLSHDIDIACWIHGAQIAETQILKQIYSPLKVDVESAADILLRFKTGAQANIHLNFFERFPHREYRFVFRDGIMKLDYLKNVLEIQSIHQSDRIVFEDFQRNEMFRKQAEDFFTACQSPSNEVSLENISKGIEISNLCQ
jgi:predicted dehydrogenase